MIKITWPTEHMVVERGVIQYVDDTTMTVAADDVESLERRTLKEDTEKILSWTDRNHLRAVV